MRIDESEGQNGEACPYKGIWAARLNCLIDDLTFGLTNERKLRNRNFSKDWRPSRERVHYARYAKAFFEGMTSDSLDELCTLIGVCPDRVFKKVKAMVGQIEVATGRSYEELLKL